jgi:hypothetical protein
MNDLSLHAPHRRGTITPGRRYRPSPEVRKMQTFFGMILGALLLACGVYAYDSMQTSSVANGEVAATNRTIVNWDVAKADWDALRDRAHKDWVRISSK